MRNLFFQCLVLVVFLAQPAILHAQPVVHHEIKIRIQPDQHRLEVEDSIRLPETVLRSVKGGLAFALHRGLQPVSLTAGVKIIQEKVVPPSIALHIHPDALPDDTMPLSYFTVTLPTDTNTFVVKYQGEIHHPIRQQSEEYARSFSETPGIISSEGIFLGGTSFWYPRFNDDLVSFSLEVRLPSGWDAVSQGERTWHVDENGQMQVRWESSEPQEEIYLISGRFTEYSRIAGHVQLVAFLRTPDQELANKYLEATARYLDTYSKLIGPYPYKKFALVENFWETGYGMPSFTLLGSKIIRLPFILYSSYPHEILHNWWGNGVYVDFKSGNWSEGLTTYLADHLIQEQRGTSMEHRRATLQKYTDYVDQAKDFPLTEFRSRSSSVTEAIGYGKTLMFFHMLRQRLGDESFIRGLQKFYRENRFKRATFSDLKSAFSSVAGEDLETEFNQWIARSGAPVLRVSQAKTEPRGKGYHLTAILEQAQPGPAYQLRIPLSVHLEGEEKTYQTAVVMNKKHLGLALDVPGRPLRLDVDPEFDLFRRLDRREISPALTLAFGGQQVLILIPSQANEKVREGYRRLAESWKRSSSGQLNISLDSEVNELPSNQTIWLFGWENRFLPKAIHEVAAYNVSLTDTSVQIGETRLVRVKHAVVLVAQHPANPELALAWLATDNVLAMSGLGQRLPHYGKYGYLGFEGDEPTNIVKGEWPVVRSPLSISVTQPDGSVAKESKSKLVPRRPLINLP